jgi:hypothetical protein
VILLPLYQKKILGKLHFSKLAIKEQQQVLLVPSGFPFKFKEKKTSESKMFRG